MIDNIKIGDKLVIQPARGEYRIAKVTKITKRNIYLDGQAFVKRTMKEYGSGNSRHVDRIAWISSLNEVSRFMTPEEATRKNKERQQIEERKTLARKIFQFVKSERNIRHLSKSNLEQIIELMGIDNKES